MSDRPLVSNEPMFPDTPIGDLSDKGLANLLVEVQMHAFESGFTVGESLIEGIRAVRAALSAGPSVTDEEPIVLLEPLSRRRVKASVVRRGELEPLVVAEDFACDCEVTGFEVGGRP